MLSYYSNNNFLQNRTSVIMTERFKVSRRSKVRYTLYTETFWADAMQLNDLVASQWICVYIWVFHLSSALVVKYLALSENWERWIGAWGLIAVCVPAAKRLCCISPKSLCVHRRIQDFVGGGGARPPWPPWICAWLLCCRKLFGGRGGPRPPWPPPGSAPGVCQPLVCSSSR